jgi:hypothetical protein
MTEAEIKLQRIREIVTKLEAEVKAAKQALQATCWDCSHSEKGRCLKGYDSRGKICHEFMPREVASA